MVIRSLHRKLLRTMARNWAQSLAVAMVVLCGVAAYICVYSAYLNLQLTRDTYYQQQRLADFEILVDRAPQTALYKIESIPGVREARGRLVRDVNVDIEGIDEPRIGRLISMPGEGQEVLNDLVLVGGRYFDPAAQDEVILSERFARENGLKLGDRFGVSVESKKYSLRVVGLGLSPEYVYMIRNVQELIPSPERFGILWVPQDFAETALDAKAACNNIIGVVDDPDDLDTILDTAEDLLDPYGVFGKVKRADMISNRFLSDEIRGLGVSARIIPTLFLSIAALILLVLLNRMVRTERTQIGLLKAYGYTNTAVAWHYVEYALLLAISGCLGGFLLGQWMAGGMVALYVQFYQFPILESRIYPEVLARSMGLTIFFSVMGALGAAIQAARIQPADAMRPEAPRTGHRLWIERLPALWQRLTFINKMILRNIARTPWRAALNIGGVGISTGLLVMGFFMMDAMEYGLRFQFQEVQREDVKVSFQTERGKEALHNMRHFPHVRRAEGVLDYPFTLSNAWRRKDAVITGLQPDSELLRLVSFDGETTEVGPHGVVLSDRLAEELDVVPGDLVHLKPLMGKVRTEHDVPVRAITKQFLGTTAYMNIEAMSALLREPFAMNAALIRLDTGMGTVFNRSLKEVAGIGSVAFNGDLYASLKATLGESSRMMNVTLLIFAGIIAFSIIYNVTSVSLAERQRELASLRVLGLTQAEVGSIMYRENFLLGFIGALAGIPLGAGICKLLVTAYSNDLYRLPYYISQQTFVISVCFSFGFVLLANIAVWRKIRHLDLVEVLKERE